MTKYFWRNFLFVVLMLLLLGGCGKHQNDYVWDQCLRIQLAQQCMVNLPAGPISTHYNDWDEVVYECDRRAESQSRRQRQYIKPECVNEY
jgi:uncharacterized protein YcfL